MFRFANQEYLFLLLIALLVIGVFAYAMYKRNKNLETFGNISTLMQFMPGYTIWRYYFKFALFIIAFVLGIIVVCRPQFGSKLEIVKKSGVETMIVMDVSNSMLAQDIQPNRLERSKQMINKFIDGINNDKVGLIIFAGQSFTQLPMTADYRIAKMYVSNITTDLIPTQGTAIGSAINLAARSFSNKEDVGRTVVIITDGENHEDDAVSAAEDARKNGIQVNVIGIGKVEGSPIPNNDGSYRKDKSGQVVVTKLNEQMCQEIAKAGGGIYVHADNSNNALKVVQNELSKSSSGEVEEQVFTEFDEQFQLFAFIAFFFLLIDLYIREKKNKFFSKFKIFE